MASYTGYSRGTSVSAPARQPSRICPDCGGLECFCRPRFFAGQLLTEQELNRLDQYIVGKNRLHNRHLHGWGVVCGLDVVCDDCGDGVLVKTGYALSPCGDDIVVCHETPVDICALIEQCRKKSKPDCGDPPRRSGCDDDANDWVLAICYEETPSRGVMPLRGASSCGCGCTGGGHSDCGCGGRGTAKSGDCGCGGKGAPAGKSGTAVAKNGCGCSGRSSATASTKCTPPLQCEPTLLCEGYRFCAYPVPRRASEGQQSPMVERFMECLRQFTAALPGMPDQNATQQELHEFCCDLREGLLAYLRDYPGYDCTLAHKVGMIVCPAANLPSSQFQAQMAAARQQFLLAALQIMLACLCRALMPPCPEPVMDNCVPLAVVTVRRTNGCKVVRICNWTTHRKYATTLPNLQYWLSVLPFGRMLREALENFCCGAARQFERKPTDTTVPGGATHQPATPTFEETPYGYTEGIGAAAAHAERAADARASTAGPTRALHEGSPADAFRGNAASAARTRAFMRLAFKTLSTTGTSLDAERLAAGLLGGKDEDGDPYLSEVESENLLQFLVLDQMAKPALRSMFSGAFATAAEAFTSRGREAAESSADAGRDIETRLAALDDMVRSQQATIERLSDELKVRATAKRASKRRDNR